MPIILAPIGAPRHGFRAVIGKQTEARIVGGPHSGLRLVGCFNRWAEGVPMLGGAAPKALWERRFFFGGGRLTRRRIAPGTALPQALGRLREYCLIGAPRHGFRAVIGKQTEALIVGGASPPRFRRTAPVVFGGCAAESRRGFMPRRGYGPPTSSGQAPGVLFDRSPPARVSRLANGGTDCRRGVPAAIPARSAGCFWRLAPPNRAGDLCPAGGTALPQALGRLRESCLIGAPRHGFRAVIGKQTEALIVGGASPPRFRRAAPVVFGG